MNILKKLQQHGILTSTRGVQGGYRLGVDLTDVSLFESIRILEGKVEPGCDHETDVGVASDGAAESGTSGAVLAGAGRRRRRFGVAV